MSTVTEDEAGEKWCPMARVATQQQNGACNRTSYVTCIASKCMAWRWVLDDADWVDEQITDPAGGSYTTQKPPPPKGYCGAFGKPEGLS